MLCCFCFFIFLLILYKVIDRLIRIPEIGNYGDRYILVTGCDSGFGNLLVKRLDARGCHVFASCLTEKGETELKKVSSDRVHTFHLDFTKQESVHKVLDFIKSKLPAGKGLWGVMNNAGIIGKVGPPDWMNIEEYRLLITVDLLGHVDVTMTVLPLVKAERGRIVCTSSVFGRHTIVNSVPYCVAKYGVEAFVDGLRRCLAGFGCKAILIEPGIHLTPLTNADSLKANVKKAWDETTPEIREEYGEEYFNYFGGRGVAKYAESASTQVSDVVDAYEHALLGRFPRARYVVGRDAKFMWLPIQALPEWLGDWILSRLDPDLPVPKAVRNK